MMIRKSVFWGALIAISILLSGCIGNAQLPDVNENIDPKEWKMLLETGRNAKITIYHDLTDPKADEWLRGTYSKALESRYGIKAQVKERSFEEYYEKLKEEKDADEQVGSIDILIFNKQHFAKLKSAGLLYGPFVNKLNNHHNYQNPEDLEVQYCGGASNGYYAELIGRDQLFLVYNYDIVRDAPYDLDELLEAVKASGRGFSYVDPAVKSGRDFINTVFATYIEYDDLIKIQTKAELKKKGAKAIAYLKELGHYKGKAGVGYPLSTDELDTAYVDEKTAFSMSKDISHVSTAARKGLIPFGSKAFVPRDGTTGGAYYLAIPFDAPNKSSAMLAADLMLEPEIQKSKYDPDIWGNLPGVDTSIMDADKAAIVRDIHLKKSTDIDEQKLLSKRIPEIPDRISDMIYEIWKEEIK